MVPESQNTGAREDIIPRQLLSNHVPTASNMHTTTEEILEMAFCT
jgi:hypothetical protein